MNQSTVLHGKPCRFWRTTTPVSGYHLQTLRPEKVVSRAAAHTLVTRRADKTQPTKNDESNVIRQVYTAAEQLVAK